MKTCRTCGETKPLNQFPTNGQSKWMDSDGNTRYYGTSTVRKPDCNSCRKKKARKTSPVTTRAASRRSKARCKARKLGCEVTICAREQQIYREAVSLELMDGVKREVDHIVPLSDGGSHCYANLQVLTVAEHLEKSLGERA